MLEDFVRRFDGRVTDDRHQVVNTDGFVDRLVETSHTFAGDARTTGMRIHDDRVSGSDHVHEVRGQSRQRVRDRSDRSDDSERSILGDGQAVVAGDGVALEVLDAWHSFDDLQLFDLVIKPPDLRFSQFGSSEFFGLVEADVFDDLNRFAAVFHRG